MQKKLITIKNTLPALLIFLLSCKGEQKQNTSLLISESAYKAFAVQKDNTQSVWGYIIEHNHHLIIQQFFIPALPGEQVFKNKEQAEAVGNYVAGKLNRSLHPTVSKKELDSLGIITLKNVTQKK